MRTIALSAALSSMAIESINLHLTPVQLIGKVKSTLSSRTDLLGRFTGSHLNLQKDFGQDIQLKEYRLDFEKSTLLFELVCYNPRGNWEVKGFRFV